jgi:triosephosphate isomerase (TIM)
MLFIANWKMNMLPAQSLDWCLGNKQELADLGADENIEVVICPSFVSLHQVKGILSLMPGVALGAQDCSAHAQGAFTGQVSAAMLAEVGADYCIVGHSERRHHLAESNELVAEKVRRLVEMQIRAISCVGETSAQFEQQLTYDVLQAQLGPVLKVLAHQKPARLVFAYEPVWSIGTGKVAEPDYIASVVSWLHELWQEQLPDSGALVAYGGSVTEENAAQLGRIQGLGGFLIGSASLNFQKFKNIVHLGSSAL